MFGNVKKGNDYLRNCPKKQFRFLTHGGGVALVLLILVFPLFVNCGEEDESSSTPYDPLSVNWDNVDWNNYDDSNSDAIIGKASAIIGGGTEGQFQETGVGNLIADGILAFSKYTSGHDEVQIAITNGTSVGSDIQKGDITRGDVDQFASGVKTDGLVLVNYTGAQIKQIISIFVSSTSNGKKWDKYCVALVSGLSYEIVPNPDPSDTNRPTVDNVKVNGQAIDDDATYLVATSDFIGGRTGKFAVNSKITGEIVEDFSSDVSFKSALGKYIYAKGTISPVLDGRIKGTIPVIQ